MCIRDSAKTIDEYEGALQKGELPVIRGYALTTDDEVRHDVIMALMCQGRLDFGAVERAHGIRMGDYFARELDAMRGLAASGLVTFDEGAIQVTAAGWFLVRAIAMVFDQHLRKAREAQVQTVRFSRVI